MTLTKGFARNSAKTPLDQRLADMATIVANADGSPRTGVLGGANLSIVTALATMNVAVAAAEFVTSKGKADGVMIFTNDGTVNVPIPAAPASNSRIDVICVRHNDDTTGDANALPTFVVRSGAAAASPTKPALQTGDLELATLRVYAGTTAANGGSNTLTNTYQMTAGRGGVVAMRTAVERDAWTNPVDGQLVFVSATDATYQYEATVPTPGWYHVSGKPDIANISLTGVNLKARAGTHPPRARKSNGTIFLEGSADVTASTSWTGGTTYGFGTLPVGYRPGVQVEGIARFGLTFAVVVIATSGAIAFAPGQSTGAGLDQLAFPLNGIMFPDPGLTA